MSGTLQNVPECGSFQVTTPVIGRPWILVAAYDVSLGETSEGHVAFNILSRLAKRYRVVLLTRRNNRMRLLSGREFRDACPGVRVIGFDLPRWASWWKQGARFYGLYAYLWQMFWPMALRRRARLARTIRVVHVLNFHNDSITTSAWILHRPVVWGPVNHNELVPEWRREFWPLRASVRAQASFLLRTIAWRFDPLLRLSVAKVQVMLSAGPWVDRRLRLRSGTGLIRLSQLGVTASEFELRRKPEGGHPDREEPLLVYAGRLDWLKGVDLAIDALARLPERVRLLIIGTGPAESRLRQLANARGVVDRVEFRAPVKRQELAEIYAGADLFLFTSPEVAGLAWVEALACGLPVAGFSGETELAQAAERLPGIHLAEDVANRETAVSSYAATISRALAYADDRTLIRDSVLNKYGWDRVVQTIEAAYVRALEDRQ